MSSLEPDLDQLRKKIVFEIKNTCEWGVHDLGMKAGVISSLVCSFYMISIMREAEPIAKLLMGFVPIGVGLGV